jgi:hypothetical protein
MNYIKPLVICNEPWESVSMDSMTQLPEWNGMDIILIIIDRFSKLAKIVPTKTIITTFDSAKLFFNIWDKHHEIHH